MSDINRYGMTPFKKKIADEYELSVKYAGTADKQDHYFTWKQLEVNFGVIEFSIDQLISQS